MYNTEYQSVAKIDPLGRRTTSIYDLAGRRLATIDPLNSRTTTLYDAHATIGSVRTDASGNAVFAAVPFGVYGVAVNPPVGFHDLGDLSIVFQDNIVVDEGSAQHASFALAPCQGFVRVSVLDDVASCRGTIRVLVTDASGAPVLFTVTRP